MGEVFVEEGEGSLKPKDLHGIQVDTCSRLMSLAKANQVLMTRPVFDNARQVLRGQDLAGVGALAWMNHGPYILKGVEEALEICEVGEASVGPLTPPPSTEKAHRHASAEEEPVLGWRPALEQMVPNTRWMLERKLGEGGFGEVWLGRDDRLKERRVFKFCFRADRVRSLKREVTLFRLLKEKVGQHPNIIGIQEVFFDAPPYYIVMDYAEATDLRAWCEAQGGVGKVPLATRLEIVAQVAEALQAAHEAGVIHRDVKPSNILVSVGQASSLSAVPRSAAAGQSETGKMPVLQAKLTDFGIGQVVTQEALAGLTKLGFTQTMMSPGSTQTGTHLYMAPELLAGKPASTRSDIYSLGVVLYQLLIGDFAQPLTTDWARRVSDPLLREDLEKCFAGNAEERFANAGELANKLRELEKRHAEVVTRRAAEAAYEKIAQRRKILRTTAVALCGVALLFLLSLYVARHMTQPSTNVRPEGTTNKEALNSYKLGRTLQFQSLDDGKLTNAIRYYKEAIDKDTNYAQAYAGLADSHALLGSWESGEVSPREGFQAATRYAEQALRLNPNLSEAHASMGYIKLHFEWDWRGAEAEFKRAIALNPKNATAHHWYSHYLVAMRRFDEALSQSTQFFDADPTIPPAHIHMGWHFLMAGDSDRAVEELKQNKQDFFTYSGPHHYLGWAYEQKSMFTNAIAEIQKSIDLSPGGLSKWCSLAHALAEAGRHEEARKILEDLRTRTKQGQYVSPFEIGLIHAALRENENAFAKLNEAFDERSGWMAYLNVEPRLKPLRDDPRFKELVKKVGLPEN
ncbi:MAG: protein kinase [Verrucomicrobia bacterium]|nr:protein kinase [Verrucomicrobiota bacterium]